MNVLPHGDSSKMMDESSVSWKRVVNYIKYKKVMSVVWLIRLHIQLRIHWSANCPYRIWVNAPTGHELKLTLQFLYLSHLCQCLLLEVLLEYFELLFSHGSTHSQRWAFLLEAFHCLLEMEEFTTQVSDHVLVFSRRRSRLVCLLLK